MPYFTSLPALFVAQAADAASPMNSLTSLLPYTLMFGVIYFLLLRPASKQRVEHQQLLDSLKKDDEVVTKSGIYGRIVVLEERIVTLEIADRVKIDELIGESELQWDPSMANVAAGWAWLLGKDFSRDEAANALGIAKR